MENKFRWCYNPTVSVLILNISGINSLSKSIRLLDRIKHFTCCMSHFWQIYSSLAKISSLHDGLYPPLSLVSDATLLGHYLQTHQNVQSLCLCLHMYCWLCLACPIPGCLPAPHIHVLCFMTWGPDRVSSPSTQPSVTLCSAPHHSFHISHCPHEGTCQEKEPQVSICCHWLPGAGLRQAPGSCTPC